MTASRDAAPGHAASPRPAAKPTGSRPRWPAVLVVLGLVVFAIGYGRAILKAEAALRDGQPIVLALAPRDPRAFLTGDYMVVELEVTRLLAANLAQTGRPGQDAWIIVRPNAAGVAQYVRWTESQAHAKASASPGDAIIRARFRDGRWRVGSGAWYFAEGQGKHFAQGRFGSYRVTDTGDVLLVDLLDEARQPLSPKR